MTGFPTRYESINYKRNLFKVHWNLGNFCNYACSYCNPILHTGSKDDFVPLELVKQVVNNIVAQRSTSDIMFYFTGGEPTVHPNFLEIVDYLLDKNCLFNLVTNGSMPTSFHRKLALRAPGITFTYHAESVKNVKRFLDNVRVYPKESVVILIPMNPAYWDDCLSMFNKLFDEGYKVIPKTFLEEFGDLPDTIPKEYTPEQSAAFTELNERLVQRIRSAEVVPDIDSVVYPIRRAKLKSKGGLKSVGRFIDLTFEDGSVRSITPHQLIHERLYNTKGMLCYAGVEHINISFAGMVYRANCHQGGAFADIYKSPIFDLFDDPITCMKERCICTDDLRITKEATADTPTLRAMKGKRVIPIAVK